MLGNMLRLGAVCGKPYVVGRLYACSETCHESLMDELVKESGEFKKVIDAEGRTYEVSTREILEHGLEYEDLKKYPKWKEKCDVSLETLVG